MPIKPTLAEMLRKAIASRTSDIHTALPGKVKSYDSSKQVAEIIPVIRGVIFTEDDDPLLEDLPVIPNVPVGWMRGGGYSLQLPLAAGDHGLLVFSEACIAQWRVSGEVSEPGDLSRHDISYPFFLPCCAPDTQPLPSTGGAAVLDGPGVIRLGGPASVPLVKEPDLTAALNALKGAFNSWTPVPQDGGAALKTVLTSFFSSWPPPVATLKVKGE